MLRGDYFKAVCGFFGVDTPDALSSLSEYNPRCILAELDWVDSNQVLHTEYLSNFGYTSTATDTPANINYLDLIVSAPVISARIDESMQVGTLTLKSVIIEGDPSGAFSLYDFLQRAWRGHDVRLFIGNQLDSRNSFIQIFNGTTESISMDGNGTVEFVIADKGLLIRDNLVKGYGLYGKVFNCEPVYVGDGLSDTYQTDTLSAYTENPYFGPKYFGAIGGMLVNSSGIYQITDVRDNGVAVAFSASEGNRKITLNIPPAGQITFDAKKSADCTAGRVIYDIMLDAGVAISSLNTPLLGQAILDIGYHIDKDQTVNYMEIIQEIATSSGGFIQWGNTGQLEFYTININNPSILDIGIDDITSAGVKIDSVDDPLSYLHLGYKRNWKVQGYNSLAGIAQIDSSPYTVEYQYMVQDNGVTAQYPIPMNVSVDTLLSEAQDAEIEFDRRLNQRIDKTSNLSLECFNLLTQLKLGCNITLNYPKLNINSEKCAVIGITLDPNNNKTGLTLWKGRPIPTEFKCSKDSYHTPFENFQWTTPAQPGVIPWDIDNVSGFYHCPNLYRAPIVLNRIYSLIRNSTTIPFYNQKVTVRIIYHTTGPSPKFCGFTPVTPFWFKNSLTSKYAYFNIPILGYTNVVGFGCFANPGTIPNDPLGNDYGDGEVYIECVDIIPRDYDSFGETINTVYYP